MTDDEMVEEYLEKHNYTSGNIGYFASDYCKQSFLAGLKTERPKWHKVADGDLPKETEFIESDVLLLLVQLRGTEHKRYELGRYNFSANVFSYTHLKFVEDVVAWCEIPKYEEEEKKC